LIFLLGGDRAGGERCVREINVSRAGDIVHAGDKALTRETPVQRGRVNRYVSNVAELNLLMGVLELHQEL
jgi:hypothetical protein